VASGLPRSQLNEDATHVLDLNERLTRYALYVSSLERSNKDLSVQNEVLIKQLDASKAELKDAQDAFSRERSEMVGKVAAAEAQYADVGQQVEEERTAASAARVAAKEEKEKAEKADTHRKSIAMASDDLRQLLTENNIPLPRHLSAESIEMSHRRDAFVAANGSEAERMLDAASANSDSARVALRVAALQDKGIEPPVDEKVMDELLTESLTPEQLRGLSARTDRIPVEFLISRGINPANGMDKAELRHLVRTALSESERKHLEANNVARAVQMLASYGVMAPIDADAMHAALKNALTNAEVPPPTAALRAPPTRPPPPSAPCCAVTRVRSRPAVACMHGHCTWMDMAARAIA
jgi:hypothetical protein